MSANENANPGVGEAQEGASLLADLRRENAELLRAIARHRRAESKCQQILESSPDAVVIVASDGTISLVNAMTERLFGYGRHELIGKPVELLIPERFRESHVRERSEYSKAPRVRPMASGMELYGRRKDGGDFPAEISLGPLKTDEGTLVFASIRDVTDNRRLVEADREKEVLLKEIHHRVKNNLQVVSSLLYLQARHADDPRLLSLLADTRSRIDSIALVHERLYLSRRLGSIDFGDYLRSFTGTMVTAGALDSARVKPIVEAEGVVLEIHRAVPCALIVNELVSNAIKHAFPGGRAGEIRISAVAVAPALVQIEVSDTGVGFPSGVDFRATRTLGMQLVCSLTQQLRGTMELLREGGTCFRFRFPAAATPDSGMTAGG